LNWRRQLRKVVLGPKPCFTGFTESLPTAADQLPGWCSTQEEASTGQLRMAGGVILGQVLCFSSCPTPTASGQRRCYTASKTIVTEVSLKVAWFLTRGEIFMGPRAMAARSETGQCSDCDPAQEALGHLPHSMILQPPPTVLIRPARFSSALEASTVQRSAVEVGRHVAIMVAAPCLKSRRSKATARRNCNRETQNFGRQEEANMKGTTKFSSGAPIATIPGGLTQTSEEATNRTLGAPFFRVLCERPGAHSARWQKILLSWTPLHPEAAADRKNMKPVHKSREAAQEHSPQPALSLSKGRKPWVRETKRTSPGGAKENSVILSEAKDLCISVYSAGNAASFERPRFG
jgi:hypothetical protein